MRRPAPSCRWLLRLDVAICTDGVRLLVNGRRVTADEFAVHLADARHLTRPVAADTLELMRERGGITSAELAEARDLKLSTASERLRLVFQAGAARRTPMPHRNDYRYEVAS